MTIGKNSRKYPRSPKFVDQSNGLYGRLKEAEVPEENFHQTEAGQQSSEKGSETGVFDFNSGMADDDGTKSLLQRKSSRRCSKRKKDTDKSTYLKEREKNVITTETSAEATVAHPDLPEEPAFQCEIVEDDNLILIDKRKHRKAEEKDTRVAKRSTMKQYRQAIDRAFRRGWETFIANLYSVTITPIVVSPTSSSSKPSSAFVDYH
ncbi:uncharacterized protein sb:cb1058 [Erpetoichthys calabaricus]|uniref:uncharacterized protein sb:cb1058 n=1 Tax=Erpetoichthys calabaricus TaxID=27687 RepID=UPI00109EE638|nr:uncharacterized protein sb:cb1058 [Erpetoichthys calabaricus]XP_028658314.1 uncharacterized protein sb:cb1058 [Erpetoichthys calabaricus]